MQHRAFTLLESLVVLSLIAILMVVTTSQPFDKLATASQYTAFIDLLRCDLKLAKDQAIMYGIRIEVDFSYSQQTITLTAPSQPQLSRQIALPTGYRILEGSRFNYLADGRVDKFKTVQICDNQKHCFAIKFQLGSGIFDLQP